MKAGVDLTDRPSAWWPRPIMLKELDPARLVVGKLSVRGIFSGERYRRFPIYYAMPDHYHQWQE